MSNFSLKKPSWVAVLAIAGFSIVLLGISTNVFLGMNRPGEIDASRWILRDYRDAVYYPVVSVLDGHNPYDTEAHLARYPVGQPCSPYSPHFLLFHIPFALLPHNSSQILYFGFSVGLTLVLASGVLLMCGRRPDSSSVFLLALLIMLSRPGRGNLLLGQTTLEFVLAVYVALWFGRKSPWISATALAVALMKPTFGVPLALLMLCNRWYRSVIIGVSMAFVASLGPILLLINASGGVQPFIETVRASFSSLATDPSSNPVISVFRLDIVALASRLLGSPLGLAAEALIFVVVIGTTCLALHRMKSIASGDSADRYKISLMCIAILIASYQQSYSALLLVFPLTNVVLENWFPADVRTGATTRFSMTVLLSIPMANYLATWRVVQHIEIGSWPWLLLTSMNGTALLAAFCVCVSFAFRTPLSPRTASQTTLDSEHDLNRSAES